MSDAFENEPVLETPPQENSAGRMDVLLADPESLAYNVAKLGALEALIGLLTKDSTFQDFMREILLVLMRAVKSEAGSILEVDEEKKHLFFRAAAGYSSDRVSNFIIPLGQGVAGHVADSRQPMVVSKIDECELHLKAIQEAVNFETKNMAALPIIIRGRVFAVVEVLNRVGAPDYSSADLETLVYLCSAASKIIEARLMIAWTKKEENAA